MLQISRKDQFISEYTAHYQGVIDSIMQRIYKYIKDVLYYLYRVYFLLKSRMECII